MKKAKIIFFILIVIFFYFVSCSRKPEQNEEITKTEITEYSDSENIPNGTHINENNLQNNTENTPNDT